MTVHIYPRIIDDSDIPKSEKDVFDLLSKLNDDFYIYHSVQWEKVSNKWRTTWKENDFLILNKKLGMLVMEVKGGEISYKDGVFHQTNILTREEKILSDKKRNDPLSQAIDGVYHYRKLFDNIEYNFCNRFPIEATVWFPSCEINDSLSSFPEKYRNISFAILDNNSFNEGKKSIYNIFESYSKQNGNNCISITDDEFNRVIELISNDFNLVAAPGVMKDELDYSFLKLTNEQSNLLDYISEQKASTIEGAAGTGKTIIAKEAARRYALEGRKVLFLCFNQFLIEDIKKKYPYNNVEYFNINLLINKYFPHIDLSSNKTRVEYLYKIDWDKLNYDDVIIDEAQDFEEEEILYFSDYTKLKNGHFLVFYDRKQLVKSSVLPKWIIDSECRLKLNRNCRNTLQIASSIASIVDLKTDINYKMVNGPDTYSCFSNNHVSCISKIVKKYVEPGDYSLSDITILTLKTEEKSILGKLNKIGNIKLSSTRNSNSILFTTARKFKGLESRIVIVIDIDSNNFKEGINNNLLYVACSRATQVLTLLFDSDKECISSIANTIDNKSGYTDIGKILIKTKSKILNI